MHGLEQYLTQPFHRALREAAGTVATIDAGRVRTWRQIGERVRRLAGILHEARLDHFLDYMLGTWWAGGVINPVNLRWTLGEIAYSLADCDTRILIVDEKHLGHASELRSLAPCIETVLVAGSPDYEARLLAAEPAEEHLRGGDDLAAILYTGGTTGKPKGVMLTHRSMMASALGYAGTSDCAPGACMMHTAPLFHVGAISGLIAAMLRRSVHVFVPGFDAEAVMRAVAAHSVTDLFLVPTMIQALLDHPAFANHDLSSIERIIYGAAPIPAALMDRLIEALPRCGFVQAYGMTELSPVATLLGPADHRALDPAGERIRSAGRATMTVELRIVDEHDQEVPVRTHGEIVARGEGVMLGYWNRPEETAAALRGGWMHTGDIGWMDEAGYVHVVDRLKDMIVSGGENVYSVEVEGALASHPSVAQCAVVGRPHPHWGESVHAVIVVRPGETRDETALLAHCRARIAGYKCPRSFEFRDALPLSAAGKILKTLLRT
jgi:acyl-CoA synthetase (AMP-forming)/AMP-acid ligase II